MVKDIERIKILVNPTITPKQLFSFYERNDICEKNFGIEVASKVLYHSSLIVGAFCEDELIGIARAMFDGCSAVIMEFSLDLRYQGENLKFNNGSLIEKDGSGIGEKMGNILLNEQLSMGATFISCHILGGYEEEFYQSLGFRHNKGILSYYIDKRPYVIGTEQQK